MIVLLIAFTAIVFLLLLRVSVGAEYGADGIFVHVKVLGIKVTIYPTKPKKEKSEKQKQKELEKKEKKAQKKEKKKEQKKAGLVPGPLSTLKKMIPPALKALNRLRRRLLITELTIYYLSAGEDAAKTAMTYGYANVAFGSIVPLLEKSFRIKNRDLRASADFTITEPKVYVCVKLSIAVWEVIFIASALLPILGKQKSKS